MGGQADKFTGAKELYAGREETWNGQAWGHVDRLFAALAAASLPPATGHRHLSRHIDRISSGVPMIWLLERLGQAHALRRPTSTRDPARRWEPSS